MMWLRFFLLALLLPSLAGAALPAGVDGKPLPTLAPMLERVTPAVVNIATLGQVKDEENPLLQDPIFRYFFNLPDRPRKRVVRSLGSGVVVDAKGGLILTNHHVIAKADRIRVTLKDGREVDAELVGSDEETDVAVLRVGERGLSALVMADSNALRVGDFVVAIGNPFGLGQTVTSGIVSALGRSGLGIEGYEDFIQTDASINPGNSGGALVDLDGRLVGINTAILAPSGGNVGIGFAIPINMVQKIMAQLVAHGEVRRGLLGIASQDLDPELANAFGVSGRIGAVITRVTPRSAAQQAGVQAGDIVVAVNGQPVRGAAHLRNLIGLLRVGERLDMEVLRKGASVKLQAVIAEPKRQRVAGEGIDRRLAGALLESRPDEEGRILVVEVSRGMTAARIGLRAGDWILAANEVPVATFQELKEAVGQSRRRLLLTIERDGREIGILVR